MRRSWYRDTQGPRLASDPLAASLAHPHLGFAGVIAFPHLWAASMGEYGSPQAQRWAAAFHARGMPVRACHATWLTLVGSELAWGWRRSAAAAAAVAAAAAMAVAALLW